MYSVAIYLIIYEFFSFEAVKAAMVDNYITYFSLS